MLEWQPKIVQKDSLRRTPNGRRLFTFCHTKSPPKVVYSTLEAAWCGAQLLFAERGLVTTPYFCWSKVEYLASGPRYIPRRKNGCGRWHLSRTVRALPA